MAYTAFDNFVAWCRFRAAEPHVRPLSFVCDIGCGLQAAFLKRLQGRISGGVGLDYQLAPAAKAVAHVVLTDITHALPLKSGRCDHVVMLAVFEHLKDPHVVLTEAHRVLAPGGSVIMTWPNAAVDPILHVLRRLSFVSKEMESEHHQQRIPVPEIERMLTAIGFERCEHRTFEFGLNNLLVAHKPTGSL